jgi:cardiolipin synthase (CMP-forming)
MDGSWLTLPNAVSIARLVLIPVFVWLVAIDQIGAAGVVLAIIGSTDWVDGYLARRLDQVSEVGKILDPLADRIAVAVGVVAGLIAGVLPGWLGWGIILREVLIAVGAIYGWSKGVTRLDVRQMGKLATLLLYSAVAGIFLGKGFDIDWFTTTMVVIGAIGLVLYYAVGVAYFGDMRAAIRRNDQRYAAPPEEDTTREHP